MRATFFIRLKKLVLLNMPLSSVLIKVMVFISLSLPMFYDTQLALSQDKG